MIDGEPVTALEISEMEQEFNTLKEAEDEKIKEIAAKFAEEEAERARIQAEEDERLAKERAEEEERFMYDLGCAWRKKQRRLSCAPEWPRKKPPK